MDFILGKVPPIEKLFVGDDFNDQIGKTSRAMKLCMEVFIMWIEMKEELQFWILLEILSVW